MRFSKKVLRKRILNTSIFIFCGKRLVLNVRRLLIADQFVDRHAEVGCKNKERVHQRLSLLVFPQADDARAYADFVGQFGLADVFG